LSRTIAELVIRTRQAVLTRNALKDVRFKEGGSVQAQRIQAAVCVPVLGKDEVLGVLYADAVKPGHVLDQEDLRLLSAIGLQTGAELEIARLIETLARERDALREANQKIRAAQNSLVQSEKLAAVGRLSAGIAHDIKTPLSVMLGYTGMLKAKLDQKEIPASDWGKMRQYGVEIEKAIAHGNALLQNLLKFASPSEPEKVAVDVNALVLETLALMDVEFNKAGVAVESELNEVVPLALADPNQLKQVLINLLVNALQALDKKEKKVRVRSSARKVDAGSWVCLEVEDNGVGMSERLCQTCFEPFFTTKQSGEGPGGVGLGLSVSFTLVQANGGSLEVVSKEGKGTTFFILLPVATGT